jgi:hypothetical protein
MTRQPIAADAPLSLDDVIARAKPELRHRTMQMRRQLPEECLAGSVTLSAAGGTISVAVVPFSAILEGLRHARDEATDRVRLEMAESRFGLDHLPTCFLLPTWQWHVRTIDVAPHLRLVT